MLKAKGYIVVFPVNRKFAFEITTIHSAKERKFNIYNARHYTSRRNARIGMERAAKRLGIVLV